MLVLNAGQALGFGPITSISSTDLLNNLNVNIVGPHNLLKAFSPFLIASKEEKKTIVLISSLGGSITGLPSLGVRYLNMYGIDYNPMASYSTSKVSLFLCSALNSCERINE